MQGFDTDDDGILVDERTYLSPNTLASRVFVVQYEIGGVAEPPEVRSTLKSAIDWAAREQGVPSWKDMFFRVMDTAPKGHLVRYWSAPTNVTRSSRWYIYELIMDR